LPSLPPRTARARGVTLAAGLAVTSLVSVVSLVSFAPTARAAGPEDDPALEALRKGYELKKAGKCAEAVVFLKESFEKKPAAKTVLNLAECEESAGKFLLARTHYREGKRLAEAESSAELSQLADARIFAIAPRIPRVSFVVARGTLTVDGQKPSSPSEVELDPGDHVAKVFLDGHDDAQLAISLVPGDRRSFTLEAGPQRTGSGSRAPTTPVEEQHPGRTARIAGAITFGAGLVVVGVGTVLGLGAKSSYDDAKAASCDATGCDPQGLAAIDSARSRAGVSTALFVVGSVAAVGGAVLYLTAPSSSTNVRVGVRGTSLALSGTF
jgi:hypothetical protein